jgi:DNA-binding transcriptional LysR family regulator
MFERLFDRQGLSLDRLRTLCALAESGSLAAAAGRNASRQSQYSRQLGELEEHFGVELARRRGRSLELTPAGLELAQLAREQLGALCDFSLRVHREAVTFDFGAGDTLLTWLVLPRLRARETTSRRITFKLHTLGPREIRGRLGSSSLDFGLVDDGGGLLLGRLRYTLFVPRALLSRTRERIPEALLESLPLAIPYGDEEFEARFEELRLARGLREGPALRCETFPQAARALRAGGYAAILPHFAKAEVDTETTLAIEAGFLKRFERAIRLVSNPRAIRLRPDGAATQAWLAQLLRCDP